MNAAIPPAEAILRINLQRGLSLDEVGAIQKMSTAESFDDTIVELIRKGLAVVTSKAKSPKRKTAKARP